MLACNLLHVNLTSRIGHIPESLRVLAFLMHCSIQVQNEILLKRCITLTTSMALLIYLSLSNYLDT